MARCSPLDFLIDVPSQAVRAPRSAAVARQVVGQAVAFNDAKEQVAKFRKKAREELLVGPRRFGHSFHFLIS